MTWEQIMKEEATVKKAYIPSSSNIGNKWTFNDDDDDEEEREE